MSEIVKLYNPANASTLTQEQIEGLQKLTSAEIKELARAYPNSIFPKSYLLIIDSSRPVKEQLVSLSTFENLWNLRERNGRKSFVAYAFRAGFKPQRVVAAKPTGKTEIMDLSDAELLTLPGFKTATESLPEEKVEVKKIKRKKIETNSI